MISMIGIEIGGERYYAKKATAPVGPKAFVIFGKETVNIPAQKRFVATDRLIPTSELQLAQRRWGGRFPTYHDGIEGTLQLSR